MNDPMFRFLMAFFGLNTPKDNNNCALFASVEDGKIVVETTVGHRYLLSPEGARKLAAVLNKKADEAERKPT